MNKKTEARISFIFKLVLLVLFLSVIFTLIGLQLQIADKTRQNGRLKAELREQELINGQISEQILEGLTLENVEIIAREKLDMILPGERVYRDVSGY